MTDESSPGSYVSCDCPQCGTRLHFPLTKAGKPARCSMCAHVLRVPRPELRPRDPGTASNDIYALASEAQQRTAAGAVDEPPQVPAVCPVCGFRRYVAAEYAGKRTRCKDCGTPFRIPAPPVPLRIAEPPSPATYVLAPEDPPRRRASAGQFGLTSEEDHSPDRRGAAAQRSHRRCPPAGPADAPESLPGTRSARRGSSSSPDAPRRRKELLPWSADAADLPDADGTGRPARRRLEDDAPDDAPPPRWTFFSGVFSLPLHLDVLPRTTFFALGLAVFGVVAVYGWQLSGYGSFSLGMFSAVGVGFIFLAALGLGIWAFSYGSACFLAILHETAHGARRIADWHDPDWREWVYSLLHLAYVFTLCLLVARGAALLLGTWVHRTELLQTVLIFVLFPILLLGTVERQSIFNPFSLLVVGTLGSAWWCWGLFYVLAGGMFVALLLLTSWYGSTHPYAAALLLAPAWAAYAFLYARLLGRLIWRALLLPEQQAMAAAEAERRASGRGQSPNAQRPNGGA